MIVGEFLDQIVKTNNPFLASKRIKTLIKSSKEPEKVVNQIIKIFGIVDSYDPNEARLIALALVSQAVTSRKNLDSETLLRIAKTSVDSIKYLPKSSVTDINTEAVEQKAPIKLPRGYKGTLTRQIVSENPYASAEELIKKVMGAIGVSKSNAQSNIFWARKKIQEEKAA